jgi:hypothetical protein
MALRKARKPLPSGVVDPGAVFQPLHQCAPGVDTLDNCHAIDHAAGTTIPLGEDEHVPCIKGADRPLELRSVLDALAGCLLLEDPIAPLGHQCPELAIQVLFY